MKPSPSQARLLRTLRDEPTKFLRIYFAMLTLTTDKDRWGNQGPELKSVRETAMSCLRVGWLERESTLQDSYGSGPSYYKITLVGQRAIMNLRPEDFVSPKHEPGPSVAGKAAKVIRALAGRHVWHRGWVFIPEAPGGIDALAVSCFMSTKYKCVGYEVKVSRTDFMAELRAPDKTKRSAFCCTQFFFACPAGLIKPVEVADPYGLVYVNENGRTRMVKRSSMPPTQPTWHFLGALIRRITAIQEAP